MRARIRRLIEQLGPGLITGAADGIGKETAHRLVKEGAHIVCVDKNVEAAQATAKEITDKLGTGIGVAAIQLVAIPRGGVSWRRWITSTLIGGAISRVVAAVTSAADSLVATGGDGKIDISFLPAGVGADTKVIAASENLAAGDFVITPNGTWHEHGVSADGTTCLWQDGLDIPFVNAMEANFYEVHPDLNQAVGYAVDDMTKTWGNPGLTPSTGKWSHGYSPMFKYEWEPTYVALSKYAGCTEGSPFDGVMMEYVNPTTNGPVMRTMGASMQMLRAGEATKAHRHTGKIGRAHV